MHRMTMEQCCYWTMFLLLLPLLLPPPPTTVMLMVVVMVWYECQVFDAQSVGSAMVLQVLVYHRAMVLYCLQSIVDKCTEHDIEW
jgi:hypothetical protein